MKLPPGINLDELAGLQPLPSRKTFDKSLAADPALPAAPPRELDADSPFDENDQDDDDDDDDNVILVQSHLSQKILPDKCPFSFLYLSSEDASQPPTELAELSSSNSLPNDFRKQGVSNIPVTADQVLNSDGDERFKWMAAGRKELDNLTGSQTIQSLSPKEKEELKERTRKEGKKYIERPSKGVFSIKLDKYKVRIVACSNKTHAIYGKLSASDLDAAMLRFLLSWGASSPNNCLASRDITAAFLTQLCLKVG